MKSLTLALLLLASVIPSAAQNFLAPPDAPSSSFNPEFPLRAHIFTAHWNRVRGEYQGFGHGDLLGETPIGFDYTYRCDQPFLHNEQSDEFYRARWKQEDVKLVLLMQKVGSGHLHRCELNVALKPVPYGSYAVPLNASGGDAK